MHELKSSAAKRFISVGATTSPALNLFVSCERLTVGARSKNVPCSFSDFQVQGEGAWKRKNTHATFHTLGRKD